MKDKRKDQTRYDDQYYLRGTGDPVRTMTTKKIVCLILFWIVVLYVAMIYPAFIG